MPRAVLKKMPIELSFNRNMQRQDLGWDDQREMPNGKDLMCTNRNLQEMKFRLFIVLLKGGYSLSQKNRGLFIKRTRDPCSKSREMNGAKRNDEREMDFIFIQDKFYISEWIH